jgi:hypothetical protein
MTARPAVERNPNVDDLAIDDACCGSTVLLSGGGSFMGKTLASMTGAVMISVAFTLPTFAQNYSPGSNQNQPSQPTQMQDQPTQMNQGTGVPNVSSLTPFGAETNYMSLAGIFGTFPTVRPASG